MPETARRAATLWAGYYCTVRPTNNVMPRHDDWYAASWGATYADCTGDLASAGAQRPRRLAGRHACWPPTPADRTGDAASAGYAQFLKRLALLVAVLGGCSLTAPSAPAKWPTGSASNRPSPSGVPGKTSCCGRLVRARPQRQQRGLPQT